MEGSQCTQAAEQTREIQAGDVERIRWCMGFESKGSFQGLLMLLFARYSSYISDV